MTYYVLLVDAYIDRRPGRVVVSGLRTTPDGTYIRFPTSRIDPRPEVRLPARTRIPMGM
jgi:hypothetical protein